MVRERVRGAVAADLARQGVQDPDVHGAGQRGAAKPPPKLVGHRHDHLAAERVADEHLREELEVLQQGQHVGGGGGDAVFARRIGGRPAPRAAAVAPQVDEEGLPVREALEEPVGEAREVAAGAEDAVDEDDGRGLARARGEVAELRSFRGGLKVEGEGKGKEKKKGGGGRAKES